VRNRVPYASPHMGQPVFVQGLHCTRWENRLVAGHHASMGHAEVGRRRDHDGHGRDDHQGSVRRWLYRDVYMDVSYEVRRMTSRNIIDTCASEDSASGNVDHWIRTLQTSLPGNMARGAVARGPVPITFPDMVTRVNIYDG
jgi:hypothetical protein